MRLIRALSPLVLALAACGLRAQEPQPKAKDISMEDELNLLLNVEIISVSKVAQRPIDAPGVVAAIPAETLRDYGWISFNDVMAAQPGFVPSQDYDRRTMSARGVFEGWNNNHVLVLVDGVPMNDNLYGTAFTTEVTPLFAAKNLEIMRGPGSALYGSNAVNGVASLNTVKADDIQGGGQARFRFGEHGTQIADVLTGGSGDLVSFVAAFNSFSTQGNEYESIDGSGRPAGTGLAAFRTNDRRSNTYFFAKLEGILDLDGWSLQFHHQRWTFGTGHGWLFVIPDQPESMKEERRIAVLKYAKESGNLTQEYALRYQWHGIDWNQRFYPSGYTDVYGTTYDSGLSEYLDTSSDELFARAQLTWKWGQDGSVVAGFEGNRFTYTGDKGHVSNTDINSYGSFAPTADGHFIPLRGFLEWTQDHPVTRTALFAQFASGKVAGGHLSVTAGLRYDKQSSDFNALDLNPGGPYQTEKLSFSQTSPRLGILFHGGSTFTAKLLIGRAFRTPAPAETFGANTYDLASNIRGLQPEIADTVELASDWIVSRNLNWRINFYEAKLKNLIAYSVANANLSTNLYTLKTRGVETELLWGVGRWNGFFNASKSKRVSEEIQDNTILPSGEVTWIPSLTANAGITFKAQPWTFSLALHHQGEAKRRASDAGYAAYRLDAVKAFNSASLRLAYKPVKGVELELGATNAFDEKGFYAKSSAYPFDYRIDPRTVWLGVRIN